MSFLSPVPPGLSDLCKQMRPRGRVTVMRLGRSFTGHLLSSFERREVCRCRVLQERNQPLRSLRDAVSTLDVLVDEIAKILRPKQRARADLDDRDLAVADEPVQRRPRDLAKRPLGLREVAEVIPLRSRCLACCRHNS